MLDGPGLHAQAFDPRDAMPDTALGGTASPASETANRKNMNLLVQLRWIAVVGQIVTIAAVELWFGIRLPLADMMLVVFSLAVLNFFTFLWLRTGAPVSNRGLLMVLLLDVAALTAQLRLSGGATNPFVSLYLLQVTVGAVLLETLSAWVVAAFACASFVCLTVAYRPVVLPETHDPDRMFSLHIEGMLVCLVLDVVLLVIFVTRMTRNLRERDAHLAALRQHAAEESHIVRMGLLATGAAHELGTPLSSLAVILGDWRRMPAITGDAERAREVEEMQAAVQRCKAILTGVLLSAGEARGDAPAATTVHAFLDGIVAEWRQARSMHALSFENHFGADLPIVSDSTLRQVVFNILDNAFEASPEWLCLTAARSEDTLVLQVVDAGPGFPPEMLTQIGKPYQSSKGRRGGGLGLFLVVNVVRKLGGFVSVHNRPQGGADVTVNLPLSAIAMGPLHAV